VFKRLNTWVSVSLSRKTLRREVLRSVREPNHISVTAVPHKVMQTASRWVSQISFPMNWVLNVSVEFWVRLHGSSLSAATLTGPAGFRDAGKFRTRRSTSTNDLHSICWFLWLLPCDWLRLFHRPGLSCCKIIVDCYRLVISLWPRYWILNNN
jgi:hypothetical protein